MATIFDGLSPMILTMMFSSVYTVDYALQELILPTLVKKQLNVDD
jgi:hypothetical protein